MLYFSGGGDVIGFINTRTWDRTQDEQLSQGWCPMVVDTNGDGVISKPWNQPVGPLRDQNEGGGGGRLVDVDLTLDTRMSPGSYGIIADTQEEELLGVLVQSFRDGFTVLRLEIIRQRLVLLRFMKFLWWMESPLGLDLAA